MEKDLAPIVLFVYNRPGHTKRALDALALNQEAEESVLYVYCDGPKANATEEDLYRINQTREIVKSQQWCKEVHVEEQAQNKGLADSIIDGVTDIVNRYGKIIVLEDDIVTSKVFLKYMNEALSLYENEDNVMHISSFVPVTDGQEKLPETYLLKFMSCWGWATWKQSWNKLIINTEFLYAYLVNKKREKDFGLDGAINYIEQLKQNLSGEIKTWAIKWAATIYILDGLCLYPKQSLVEQIGFDGSGVHCGVDGNNLYDVTLLTEPVDISPVKIRESSAGRIYLKRFYQYGKESSFNKRLKILLSSLKRDILAFLKALYKKLKWKN